MKKTFTQFFLFALFCITSTNLSAQTYNGTTWYSLWHENQFELYTIANKTFDVYAPTNGTLVFNWKYNGVAGSRSHTTKIYESSNGGNSYAEKGKVEGRNTDYPLANISVSQNINKIKFDRATGNTWSAYYKNVQLPLANHILLPDGIYGKNTDSKSFGSVTIDGQSAAQKVTLRSFLTTGNITVKSSDNAFRINSASNLSGLTYAVGANACASANGQSGAQAGGATLGDINQYAFDIYFCPTEAKEYSATITITDGTSTATVTVTGVGVKKTQQLTWAADFQADEVSLPVGEEIVNPATTNSGLALTYTSSDETILAVEGTTIKALKAGEVTLTVEQAGDDEWTEVSDSKVFTVTEKQIQYIHWTDNLTNLQVGDSSIVLTATAQVLVNAETGETQDIPARDSLITYQSADNSVVSVNGNVLTVVGEGETTVTATLPGDDDYEATVLTMPVRVRVPSSVCEAYVLNAPEEVKFEASLLGVDRSYEPDSWNGPAERLTFVAMSNNGDRVGPVEVQQYINGTWEKVDDINPPGKEWREYGYDLNRNATKVRFFCTYGSYWRYFKDVLVTQATYLETTTPAVTVEKSIIGDEITRTIAIQYSNLPAGVMIEHSNDQIQLSDNELGTSCGAYGEKIITLTVRPSSVGIVEDVITIADEATGLSLSIPVTIHTQRNTQTIVWEDELSYINVFDTVVLNATAETKVTYSVSDTTIASVEGNVLVLHNAGEVVVYAIAAESDKYMEATVGKSVVVSPLSQEIIWNLDTTEINVGDTLILNAVSTSGLEVSFYADIDGIVLVSANLLVALNPGQVLVSAVQDGNNNYLAADEVQYAITVLPKSSIGTDCESVLVDGLKSRKLLRNGQIYLQVGAHTYDVLGNVIE